MTQRSIQIVVWVAGAVILVAALAFGGWSLWTLSKQAKTLSAQQARDCESLKAEINKLVADIEVMSSLQAEAVSACERQFRDGMAALGQKTERLLQTQTQDQDRMNSLANTVDTLGQEQKKLAESQTQIGQAIAKNQAYATGQFTNAAQELADLKKRMEACAAGEADWHYFSGVDKWDDRDLEGAIKQFTRTVRLNKEAAGAYYNLALAYWRYKQLPQGCENAYQAGQCYLKKGDIPKANRMLMLLSAIDPTSALIEKLRREIAAKTATPETPAKVTK